MRYLLDTCTFMWLALPQGKLSAAASMAIDDASSESFLSEASILEIAIKHSSGKLPLPDAPRRWLPSRLEFFRITVASLNPSVLFRSGELPRVHTDPFDRLIAAHAIETGLSILSPDVPLSHLGASRIW